MLAWKTGSTCRSQMPRRRECRYTDVQVALVTLTCHALGFQIGSAQHRNQDSKHWSQVEWKDAENTPVTPQLLGTKVYEDFPIDKVLDYIDW